MLITQQRPRNGARASLAMVAVLAVFLPACASPLLSLGSSLADVAFSSASAERGQLVAEVVEIDELQQRIRLTTDDGRTGTVLYDQNTVVIRESQHRTVRTIRPGELLLIQVERDRGGQLYATRVDVQDPDPVAIPAPIPTLGELLPDTLPEDTVHGH